MRKFTETSTDGGKEIYCNCCGKRMKMEKGIAKEGVFTVEQHWGYFSEKDGQVHSFDLCETCYDQFIGKFCLPVEVKEEIEFI